MLFIQKIISLLFLFVLADTATAQPPKNLVFEGAGLRGIAYCGALEKMEENGWLKNAVRVGGTSSGAITALTVSLGYNSSEIRQLVSNTPFKKFNDGNFFFIGGINRMNKYFGWYRSRKTDKWLAKLIAAKTGDAEITFREMRSKGFKDLYVTGTCLNSQKLVVFSHETYPNMKVRDAVRISMSIPMYFEAVFIDSTGKTYHHPKNKKGLDVMVDGGITGNFPIRIFDSTKYMNATTTSNQFIINPETVGIRIDSEEQIKMDQSHQPGLAALPVNSFGEFLTAFYNMAIENLNRQPLTVDDWKRTISISNGNISPKIRKLKKQEVETLMKNGATGFDRFRNK